MTHTAGFEDGGLGYLFSNSVDNLKPLAEVLATYRPAQVREPGVSSAYSNYATAVAGLIVANVSGMPFEAYIERHILEPLGMDRSTFVEPLPERLAADMAVGYATRSGGLEAGGFEFIKNFGPAGALSATADDMAKFMIAHVNDGYYNGARILETETARLMHSRLFSHHPSVAGMAYGFYETKRNGVRFIGHGGDTIAFHSELIINPEDDFGLYLSFNTPEGAQARAAVVNAIIDYFYPGPDPDFRYPVLEGSARRIAEVSGTYRVNRRSYTKLEGLTSMFGDLRNAAGEEGELVNALGRFSEVEPYVFQRQGGHETLVFKADRSGEIRQALLGSIPVMALDKVPLLEQGSIHQLIVLLAVLAAIFVLINAVRNRNQSVPQAISRHARWSLTGSSAILLLFLGSITFVLAANPVDSLIYDFPPAGLGLVLLLPVLFALLAILCGILTVPVWRSASCNLWQRIRFTYVTVVFLALALVLNYWNVLGWNYY